MWLPRCERIKNPNRWKVDATSGPDNRFNLGMRRLDFHGHHANVSRDFVGAHVRQPSIEHDQPERPRRLTRGAQSGQGIDSVAYGGRFEPEGNGESATSIMK